MKNEQILYLVIPCYNEEEVLGETSKRLLIKMDTLIENNKISKNSKVVFIDDGSKDKTWEIIEELHKRNNMFSGIKLSINKGHQNALMAGLITAKENADIIISLDADLQDDINVIDDFIQEYYNGNEIIYGIRNLRKKDTFLKRNTALVFYKLMEKMGVNIVYNHADYRLMSKRAVCELENFKEVNLFLRGIIPLIGFKTAVVEYERHERFAGESKYPFRKMLDFALDGITSFSVKPIRMIFSLGILIVFASILVLIYAIVLKTMDINVEGWTFIVCSIWLLGGIQMLSLGIIGEYIGKMYLEVKSRPRYVIEKILISEE
jgi:polyisoprenyl-phosphate glycosyltransferase